MSNIKEIHYVVHTTGSFRMLFMLLSEYVLYVLEMLQQQNTESQYEAMLSGKVGE